MGILFTGGRVVNSEGAVYADVLVEGEHITHVGATLPHHDHQIVPCAGKLLLPGGIDVHTHFDLPVSGTHSSDDFFTGGRAAAFGGTTTHIDFAIQTRGGTLGEALSAWHSKAEGRAVIDYGLHMTVIDLNAAVEAEIPAMAAAGVPSLKLLMAYKGGVQVDDLTLFRTMQIAAEHKMLVMTHCENGDAIAALQAQALAQGHTTPIYHLLTRPPALETEATERAISLAEVAGCSLYVVHMTCEGAVNALARGRARGLPVMGETCVQYLFVDIDDVPPAGFEGAKFVCSPPFRAPHDQAVLWRALRGRTLQVVSTDHCPFWLEGGQKGRPAGKELGREAFTKIPNGVPAVEERLKLVWAYGVSEGRMDAARFVEVMSTNPARIFGMYPRKGAILPGSDADIVVWNPARTGVISAEAHHMAVDYNLFEGYRVLGAPDQVYLRGQKIVDGDQWLGQAGSGRFIPRGVGAVV